MSTRQRRVLDNLTAAGVQVSAPGGPHARYEFHHAKYAVVDERALVTTENWKPSGTGGRSSRGWGVVTSQDRVVERLVAVFDADARWRAARSWPAVREDVETAEGNVSAGTYPERVDPERLRVDGARVLIGPENAEGAVLDLLQGATESIDVVQMGVGGADQPFLQAVVGAARRGVEVRVLLSGAWYVADDNREVVDHLRGVADAESLPLEARLAEPRGRFEKIHAKGVVVDGDRVLLGSLNWNNHSARENREIALVLEGESVAAYYGRVFRQDWRGPAETVPVGLLLGCIVAITIALLRAAAVRFDAGRF
jgi:phosphatidylserine/phosphatidylglycerophosphate/cardiolipin synthase-like enzyme